MTARAQRGAFASGDPWIPGLTVAEHP